jgi:hypothetical protein
MDGKEISGLRNEGKRTAKRSMTSCLGTLRYHDVGTDVDSIPNVIGILTLANNQRARFTDFVDKGTRIAKGQHHCCWMALQHIRQQRRRFSKRPSDEADAYPLSCSGFKLFV